MSSQIHMDGYVIHKWAEKAQCRIIMEFVAKPLGFDLLIKGLESNSTKCCAYISFDNTVYLYGNLALEHMKIVDQQMCPAQKMTKTLKRKFDELNVESDYYRLQCTAQGWIEMMKEIINAILLNSRISRIVLTQNIHPMIVQNLVSTVKPRMHEIKMLIINDVGSADQTVKLMRMLVCPKTQINPKPSTRNSILEEIIFNFEGYMPAHLNAESFRITTKVVKDIIGWWRHGIWEVFNLHVSVDGSHNWHRLMQEYKPYILPLISPEREVYSVESFGSPSRKLEVYVQFNKDIDVTSIKLTNAPVTMNNGIPPPPAQPINSILDSALFQPLPGTNNLQRSSPENALFQPFPTPNNSFQPSSSSLFPPSPAPQNNSQTARTSNPLPAILRSGPVQFPMNWFDA